MSVREVAMIDTATVWDALNRLSRAKQRNEALRKRLSDIEKSRDGWREKALARERQIIRLKERAARQRMRAETWKHRCLNNKEIDGVIL